MFRTISCSCYALMVLGCSLAWGQSRPGLPPVDLPVAPLLLDSAEEPRLRVTVVTRGLSHPWALAFLRDDVILVTERVGRVRVVRGGQLETEPVHGVPDVHAAGLAGLMDIAVHPQYDDNQLVYLTYTTSREDGYAVALARGRFDGRALVDVVELFVSDPVAGNGTAASRVAFAADGSLLMTVGGAFGSDSGGPRAQDLADTIGKVIRLRDDGSVPEDNPFAGRAGHRAEVYSYGHRNQLGLTMHPQTNEMWAHENGPQGGDEANVLRPGANYGWPVVSYGRQYSGARVAMRTGQVGMEASEIVWLPSIAPSGMVFYDGDRFPAWRGNLFVGALRTGGIRNTGHLQRIVFNDLGEELRRESLLTTLRQRIRDVRQGGDGLLYVLTDADDGALLRIEPADGGL